MRFLASVLTLGMLACPALADSVDVDIHKISADGIGEKIGMATISSARDGGILIAVSVSGLPGGKRGFHVHEKGDCGAAMAKGVMTAGAAAGPHYDPDKAGSHRGPHAEGHKGDLPVLEILANGAKQTVAAPRLTLADVRGRSLMIHEGGDNYTDHPENGGGKGRVACGVIP